MYICIRIGIHECPPPPPPLPGMYKFVVIIIEGRVVARFLGVVVGGLLV